MFGFLVSILSVLNAECINSEASVNCNETINADVYADTSNGVSTSSILNVNVENMHGVHNNNNGSWSFNELNVNVNGSERVQHAVYASNITSINIGDNANLTTNNVGGSGLYAHNNSHITVGDNATVITTGGDPTCGNCGATGTGWWSYAVRTERDGSSITIGNNSYISTQGAGTYAVYAMSDTAITIGDNAVISTSGNRTSFALYATGNITVGNNAKITTYGNTNNPTSIGNGNPSGVHAYNKANINIGDNGEVTTYGNTAHALYAYISSITFGDNGKVTTYEDNSRAVYSLGGTSTTANVYLGSNNTINTFGASSHGLYANIRASIIAGNDINIVTEGAGAYALWAQTNSNINIAENANIVTNGVGSSALYSQSGSNITFGDNGKVTTYEDNSRAVYSLGGTSTTANVYLGSNNTINTFGATSHGLYANTRASINVGDNANIITNGAGAYALWAQSNSIVNIAENASIVTKGVGSSALYSQSNSSINIDKNAEILTSGANSYGVHANNASVNIDDDVLISTNGTDARAVYSTSNGNINIGDNAQIITYGPDFPTQSRNHAVYVELASNVTFGDNAYIFTSGVGSGGVYTYGAVNNTNNHILFGDNATIITTGGDPNCGQCGLSQTTGWWSYGVYLSTKDSDVTFGDNAFISTQGARAHAVYSSNTNATVYFGDNAAIFTDGNNGSVAVYASGGGKVEVGDNAVIATTGSAVSGTGLNPSHAVWIQGSSGLATNSTFIAGDNVNITTYGYDASGITASSYAFITLGDNARITTYADGRYTGQTSSNEGGFGIKIRGSLSNLTIGDNALITTYGNQALGVQIRERSSAVFGDGLTILTHGNSATALETYDRSNVTVGDNALIATTGNASHAVRNLVYASASASYAGNATTIIGKGARLSTQGDDSHAIYSTGDADAVSNIILNTDTNISASGNNSYAVYALNANGLVTTNSSSKLNILGDMTAKNGGVVDLDLKDGSYFYGNTQIDTASGINLAFDGSNSLWRVKGNSSLTTLSLTNNAKVDLTNGNPDLSNPASLIVGNILGDGGIFNVRVDTNNNISDKIFVSNSSSGTHAIIFNDKTLGGYKDNVSLQIIQNNIANPQNNYQANFAGHADIGAYTYALLFDNSTQSYYIGDTTPSGAIATEGSVVLNNAAVASSMGFLTIGYLSNYINTQNVLQRMGELRDKQHTNNNGVIDDMWIRTYFGQLGSFDENTRVDKVGYYGIQLGVDRELALDSAELYTGLTLGYLKADADYKAGDSESKLYDFGVYALYKNDNDFYIDAFIKYSEDKNSFNVKTSNDILVDGSGKSKGFSLSVETGKRYGLANSIYIEPQAELTYANHGDFTIHSSNNLKTKIDGYNSYLLRGSVVLGYSLKDTANVYLKTGYIRELDGKTSYLFNDSAKQEYKLNQNIFDNAIGLTLNSNNHNFYLEGGWQKGDEFDNLKANVGYRYGF